MRNAYSVLAWVGALAMVFIALNMDWGKEKPCEIVTTRPISPGMVIECPTGDTTQGCDTTYYYRLP